MKRKPGEDKAPSSAETAKILPPASPEEELEAFSPTPTEARRGPIKLTHPIKLPPGLLSLVALQLKTSSAGGLEIEDFFPRAYQLLCNEQRFLGGTEPRELAFIDAHARRWKAGEGFLLSAEGLEKVPPIAELIFDPANLEASCKMLHGAFKGIRFPERDPTLEKYVRECHKAVHREWRRERDILRARGDAFLKPQSRRRFARKALVFIGTEVWFLRDYIDYRAKGSAAQKAEQLVLAKRRKKALEKKSLSEQRKSST
jgi:hypothetical protein